MLQTRSLDNNRLFIPCGNMSSNNDVLLFYGATNKRFYLNIITNCFKKGCFQKLTLTSKKKMRGLLIFFDFYEMVVNQMIRTK